MMFLTPQEAATRLRDRYGIESTPYIGDLIIASDRLEDMAPFKDSRILEDPPDALLDWVALYGHKLKDERHEGRTSGAVSGAVSWRTAWPQLTPDARRLKALIAPYLRNTGRVA